MPKKGKKGKKGGDFTEPPHDASWERVSLPADVHRPCSPHGLAGPRAGLPSSLCSPPTPSRQWGSMWRLCDSSSLPRRGQDGGTAVALGQQACFVSAGASTPLRAALPCPRPGTAALPCPSLKADAGAPGRKAALHAGSPRFPAVPACPRRRQ